MPSLSCHDASARPPIAMWAVIRIFSTKFDRCSSSDEMRTAAPVTRRAVEKPSRWIRGYDPVVSYA